MPTKINCLEVKQNEVPMRIWYTTFTEKASTEQEEGNNWTQKSLPLGNGKMGINVFGRLNIERVSLNEETFWSGGPKPSAKGNEPRSPYNMETFGNYEEKGKEGQTVKEAQELIKKGVNIRNTYFGAGKPLAGPGGESEATAGGYGSLLLYANMLFYFTHKSGYKNYIRDLNLENGISNVDYDLEETHYHRDYFVSHKDDVIVTRISAEGEKKLNFIFEFQPDSITLMHLTTMSNFDGRKRNYTITTEVEDDSLSAKIQVEGTLKDNELNFYSSTKIWIPNKIGTIKMGPDQQRVVFKSAEVDIDKSSKLEISEADEIIIITTIKTDYKLIYPFYRINGDAEERRMFIKSEVEKNIEKAYNKGYNKIREDHINDFSSIFSRLSLDLGGKSDKTTNDLVKAYKYGIASKEEKRFYETLVYQYGRYLTISCSREDSQLPSNLYGIWTGGNDPAWHADFHMNINLQMNYWPTLSGNMVECIIPLVKFLQGLREPGRQTARIYYGINKATDSSQQDGFLAHTQVTPFGWTGPDWDLWGYFPCSIAWTLQSCWDHYEFTHDKDFLEKEVYPMMAEQCRMFEKILIDYEEDGKVYKTLSPSFSSENFSNHPLGEALFATPYEQTLLWQLFTDTIKAAKILGKDQDKIQVWQTIRDSLYGPIQIGADGQVKEWYIENHFYRDKEGRSLSNDGKNHRHMSHLVGIYPGNLINENTPETYKAARVSIEDRTNDSEGWANGQRINTWARLKLGDKALGAIESQLKNRIYDNLWDYHKPHYFQIDGNFGNTAGVNEMLVQSNLGYISLLPALPSAWSNGKISGILARGHFELILEWANGKATYLEILSKSGGDCTIKYSNIVSATFIDKDGNVIPSSRIIKDGTDKVTIIETTKGEIVIVKF